MATTIPLWTASSLEATMLQFESTTNRLNTRQIAETTLWSVWPLTAFFPLCKRFLSPPCSVKSQTSYVRDSFSMPINCKTRDGFSPSVQLLRLRCGCNMDQTIPGEDSGAMRIAQVSNTFRFARSSKRMLNSYYCWVKDAKVR